MHFLKVSSSWIMPKLLSNRVAFAKNVACFRFLSMTQTAGVGTEGLRLLVGRAEAGSHTLSALVPTINFVPGGSKHF